MNVESLQSAMHHDAGSLSGNSIIATAATLDYAGYVPVNNISTEAYALLAAAEALAARRADAGDLGNNWTMPERALDGMYNNLCDSQCMPPPKRFYRTFWESVSRRLLHQMANTACPP
jgi:hypothetical protein